MYKSSKKNINHDKHKIMTLLISYARAAAATVRSRRKNSFSGVSVYEKKKRGKKITNAEI